MKILDVDKFFKECGLHDNRIVCVYLNEYDLSIKIENLYENMGCEGWPETPGLIVVKNCKSINLNHLVSNWILDGGVSHNDDNDILWLTLNTGARLEIVGSSVEISVH